MEVLTFILTILSFLLTLSLVGSLFFIYRYFTKNKKAITKFIKKELLPDIKIVDTQGNINQIFSELENDPEEILTKLIEGKIANTQDEINTLSQLFKSDPDVHKYFPGMSPTNYSGVGLKPDSTSTLSEHKKELKEQNGPYIREFKGKKEKTKTSPIKRPWVYNPPGTPFIPK